jgi:hypothetical protein
VLKLVNGEVSKMFYAFREWQRTDQITKAWLFLEGFVKNAGM